jgi:hypothetical protein
MELANLRIASFSMKEGYQNVKTYSPALIRILQAQPFLKPQDELERRLQFRLELGQHGKTRKVLKRDRPLTLSKNQQRMNEKVYLFEREPLQLLNNKE